MAAGAALKAEGYASSKSLSAYLDKAASLWPQVAVLDVVDDAPPVVLRGTKIHVTATVALAGLAPEEVRVECFRGPPDQQGRDPLARAHRNGAPRRRAGGPARGAWKFAAVANGNPDRPDRLLDPGFAQASRAGRPLRPGTGPLGVDPRA